MLSWLQKVVTPEYSSFLITLLSKGVSPADDSCPKAISSSRNAVLQDRMRIETCTTLSIIVLNQANLRHPVSLNPALRCACSDENVDLGCEHAVQKTGASLACIVENGRSGK